MALNISILLVPWPIFLTALILIVAAIIVLTVLEKRLKRSVIVKKEEEVTYFERKLLASKALSGDSSKFLTSLDLLAREFFETELKTTGVRYSDLIERFNESKNGAAVKFCEVMQEALYSGEKLSKETLNFLVEKLEFLIKENEKEKLRISQMEFQKKRVEEISKQKESQMVPQKVVQPVAEVKKVETEDEVQKNLVNYLAEGIKRGFEIPALRAKLLEGGFTEEHVDSAIEQFNKINVKKQSLGEAKFKKAYEANEASGRTILARFLHPKNKEIETIKREVIDEDHAVKTKKIAEPVPYKKEKIELKKKINYPAKEPKSYQYINNFDNLDRIKEKIKKKKQTLTGDGVKGAGLGN